MRLPFADNNMHPSVANLCFMLCLALTTGCSLLGFPTSPVAHTMTSETKRMLDASPPLPVGMPRELAKQVLPTHYLEPGDELLIELDDIQSSLRIPADQQVLADGSVDLAAHGRVKVASLTLEEAEQRIRLALASNDSPPTINVRLIQSVQRYYVIGEVNSPGAYPLAGHETVLDGIVAAGGLTQRASACDLLLARPTDPCSCRVTLPVCYRAITQLGDVTTNYQLKPGDRIFVGRQTMLEELMQCCCCQKTCDRCCKQQRGCCDPMVVETDRPSFAIPLVQATEAAQEAEAASNGQPSPEFSTAEPIHVDMGVEKLGVPHHQPASLAERTPPIDPRRDGELDFGHSLE